MKLLLSILLTFFIFFAYSQSKPAGLSLNDRGIKSSKKYFDANDPYFLLFFVNAQETKRKLKLLDEQVRRSKYYQVIPSNEIPYFMDSIRAEICRDTGQLCSTGLASIKQSNTYIAQSNYIFWVNYKYWYRVGDNGKNTIDFANEFLVAEKIKYAAIVSPPPEKNIKCMGKTIAHIYLFTNKKAKFDYSVAKMKFRQVKLGNRWIGHN